MKPKQFWIKVECRYRLSYSRSSFQNRTKASTIVVLAMPFTDQEAAKFTAMYNKAAKMSDDDTQLVAIVYDMVNMCTKANLAYETVVPPNHMGFIYEIDLERR